MTYHGSRYRRALYFFSRSLKFWTPHVAFIWAVFQKQNL